MAGSVEPVAAAGPDGVAVAVVFVGGGDVADGGVHPEGVVLGPDAVELSFEVAGVGDLLQVRPLGLDVAEQGLDPGLVGGGVWASEVLPSWVIRFSGSSESRV